MKGTIRGQNRIKNRTKENERTMGWQKGTKAIMEVKETMGG